MGEALITRRGGGGVEISGYVEREAVAVDDIAANHSCYVQDFSAMPSALMAEGTIAYSAVKDGVMFAIHVLLDSNAYKGATYAFYTVDALERIKGVVATAKAYPKAMHAYSTIHKIDTDHFIVKVNDKSQVDVCTINWTDFTVSCVTLTVATAAGSHHGLCISVTPNRTPYVFTAASRKLYVYRVDNATGSSPTLTACGSVEITTTADWLYVCALTDNIFGVVWAYEYYDCVTRILNINGSNITVMASKTMTQVYNNSHEDGVPCRCGQMGQVEPEYYKGEYIQPFTWWEAVSGTYHYYCFFKYNPDTEVATITDTVYRPQSGSGFEYQVLPYYGLFGNDARQVRCVNAYQYVSKSSGNQTVQILTVYPDTGGVAESANMDSSLDTSNSIYGLGRALSEYGYIVLGVSQSTQGAVDIVINRCGLPVASLYFGKEAGIVSGRADAGEQVAVQFLDPTVDN